MMWTYIGPFGNLLQIKCPMDPVEAPIERGGTEQVTLAGIRYVQRPSNALRSWNLTIDLAQPDEIGSLIALEQGVYGPPPYHWYNPVAARLNMLTPGAAAPGIPGAMPWVSAVPANALAVVGVNQLEVPSAATQAESPVIPVLADEEYTASADFLDRPGGTTEGVISMRWVDAAGATISTSSSGTVTSPNRAVVTATAPSTAAGVVIVLNPTTATTGRFGSIMLRQASSDRTWHPGMGATAVSIPAGLGQQFQQAYDDNADGIRRQLIVRLVEVG
jgi:hypothetical protein